jgi:formate hydrogenlyase subunit 4
MALVLAAGAAADGRGAQGQGASAAAAGPFDLQPYRDLLRFVRKESVLAENASWLFRAVPYLMIAMTWVAASLVPTFATAA